MTIPIGQAGRAETVVTQSNTARSVGSGSLPVFATPCMTALMEQAACDCLLPFLEKGQSSVGTALSIVHSSATPIGLTVWAESCVTAVNGKKITFSVTAFDEAGKIGEGTHERFLITNDRFLAKAEGKKETH